MKRVNKVILSAVICGFLLGIVWAVAIRYVSYKSDLIHYHANFALYINGQRDEFKDFTFYEEVQACKSENDADPKHRVHMHDQKNDLVHVHASAVTWGQFFANLGYGLTNNLIKTDTGVYINGENGKKLTFTLNGEQVTSIANKVIESEDVLLINYGTDSSKVLNERFESIPKTAHEANEKQDPSSCSGVEDSSFWGRLKAATGY